MFGNTDWTYIGKLVGLLSGGALTSIELFFLTLLFSLPLGLLVALGELSENRWVSAPIKKYVLVMRGTPLMLQIMFVYFAPSTMLPDGWHINLNRFVAAVIAFTLNYAAYFAEIYRGGIESIPQGQYEAASVLGFTRSQTFFRIILPQVIKRILPPISNEVITLVKDTALVQVIGISDLFRVATNELNRTFSSIPLLIAGVYYLVMNWVVTEVLHAVERKMGYYK